VVKCFNWLTKFCVILAGLTGDGFVNSGKRSFELLKRHFVGGYVANRVGDNVLGAGAFIFSLVVGFICWVTVDAYDGLDPFRDLGGNGILKAIIYIFAIFVLYYPIFGLLLIALWPQIWGEIIGWGFTYGLFCAILSHFMFEFMARVVLDTVDTLFVCVAIDKDNHTMSPVALEIHQAMMKMPEFAGLHAASPNAAPGQGYVAVAVPNNGQGYSQVPQDLPYTGQYQPPGTGSGNQNQPGMYPNMQSR